MLKLATAFIAFVFTWTTGCSAPVVQKSKHARYDHRFVMTEGVWRAFILQFVHKATPAFWHLVNNSSSPLSVPRRTCWSHPLGSSSGRTADLRKAVVIHTIEQFTWCLFDAWKTMKSGTFSSVYECPPDAPNTACLGQKPTLAHPSVMLKLASNIQISFQRRLSLFIISQNMALFKMLEHHHHTAIEGRFYSIYVHMDICIYVPPTASYHARHKTVCVQCKCRNSLYLAFILPVPLCNSNSPVILWKSRDQLHGTHWQVK